MRTVRHTHLVLVAALLTASCRHPEPAPRVAPPPALGLDPAGTFRAYLAARPASFKLRHQVESRFAGRDRVIEGFLVLERPDRFYVSARSPMGPALFDVRSVPPAPLAVRAYLPELRDGTMARYLARDIRRIYLVDCPDGSPVSEEGGGVVVARCRLEAGDEAAAGDDGPDDALTERVAANGVLLEKTFARGARPTVVIRYGDERPVGPSWLAHRIALVHQSLPYRLDIALVGADLAFDTSRVLAGPRP